MAGLKRRDILAILAAIGGAPAMGWAAMARPPQERLPWGKFRKTDDYPKFAATIRAMKAIDDVANPNSWLFWANIHQTHCPHGKDYFLAWHRGYLSLFEARLREISGSAALRLPYWDYFADAKLPAELTQGNAATNPLFETRKGGDVGRALAYAPFGSEVTGFERGVKNCFEASVEAFHNNVHNLIGGRMATMQSPQDIVFWLHHANIDRLWAAWTRAGRGRQMPAADTPYWDGQLDYAGGLAVTRADAMTTETLGYHYADLAMPALDQRNAAGETARPPEDPRDVAGRGRPRRVGAPAPMPAPMPAMAPPPPPPPVMMAPSAASPLVAMALLLGNESAPIRMALRRAAEGAMIGHDHRADEVSIVLDAVSLTDLGREGGFFYKLYLDLGDTAPGKVPDEERLLGSVGAFQIAAALGHAQDGQARIELPAGDVLRRFARGRDPGDLGVVFARVDAGQGPQGSVIRIERVSFLGDLG